MGEAVARAQTLRGKGGWGGDRIKVTRLMGRTGPGQNRSPGRCPGPEWLRVDGGHSRTGRCREGLFRKTGPCTPALTSLLRRRRKGRSKAHPAGQGPGTLLCGSCFKHSWPEKQCLCRYKWGGWEGCPGTPTPADGRGPLQCCDAPWTRCSPFTPKGLSYFTAWLSCRRQRVMKTVTVSPCCFC